MTRERISHILELREMLLPFQTGFNLVNAAVVCCILESISGFNLVSAAVVCAILESISGFNLVNAAVVCAILESISGLEPSSDTTEARFLKLATVSSFCPFTLISLLMPLGLFFINLVFSLLSTDLHAASCGGFVETTK